jgi:hypothetical protein
MNDGSIQRDLPVGSRIEKIKGDLNFKLNGEIVKDFPVKCYNITICFGVLLILIGLARACYRIAGY